METTKVIRNVWCAYQSVTLGFLFAGLSHLAWTRGDRIALLFMPGVLAAIMNALAPVAAELAEELVKPRDGGED